VQISFAWDRLPLIQILAVWTPEDGSRWKSSISIIITLALMPFLIAFIAAVVGHGWWFDFGVVINQGLDFNL
jgi:hypothetical protein